MPSLTLKPTHKVVSAYYDNLAKFAKLGIKHETAVRSAFQELLEHCARQFDWKLVPEYRIKRKGQADASADGALLDNYGLNHGLWEPQRAGMGHRPIPRRQRRRRQHRKRPEPHGRRGIHRPAHRPGYYSKLGDDEDSEGVAKNLDIKH
jgi:hypothetical protein